MLVIAQNLSAPLDRRVCLERQVLEVNGYDVSVICSRVHGDPARKSAHVVGFADAVERPLDDDELRVSLAQAAGERVSTTLDWGPVAVPAANPW